MKITMRKILAIVILYLGIAQIFTLFPVIPGSQMLSYNGLFGFFLTALKELFLRYSTDVQLHFLVDKSLYILFELVTVAWGTFNLGVGYKSLIFPKEDKYFRWARNSLVFMVVFLIVNLGIVLFLLRGLSEIF